MISECQPLVEGTFTTVAMRETQRAMNSQLKMNPLLGEVLKSCKLGFSLHEFSSYELLLCKPHPSQREEGSGTLQLTGCHRGMQLLCSAGR